MFDNILLYLNIFHSPIPFIDRRQDIYARIIRRLSNEYWLYIKSKGVELKLARGKNYLALRKRSARENFSSPFGMIFAPSGNTFPMFSLCIVRIAAPSGYAVWSIWWVVVVWFCFALHCALLALVVYVDFVVGNRTMYTGCSLNIVFFRTLAFLCFPWCQCVCTHTRQVEHQRRSRTGRVQKNHKILRKKHNI